MAARYLRTCWLRGGCLDPVGAATVARQDVLCSGDGHFGAEGTLKCLELGATQRATRRRGIADRAVMLDEDVRISVGSDLGEVALVGTKVGKAPYADCDVFGVAQRQCVPGGLSIRPSRDHPVERLVAQC